MDALDADREGLKQTLRKANRLAREQHLQAHPVEPGKHRIGASDADQCLRPLWYRNTPPDGYRPVWTDDGAALMGTLVHEGFENRWKALYPWLLVEYEVHPKGLDRASRVDRFDPVTGVLTELKTTSQGRMRMLENQDGPSDLDWHQPALLGLALEDEGYTVRVLRMPALRREDGREAWYTRAYDRGFAEAARDRLLGAATILDAGGEIPRGREGPSLDPICRNCPAVEHCWNVTAAREAGRSPESLMALGMNPDGEAVAGLIAEHVARGKDEGKAKRDKERLKALLDGVPTGRYGDYLIRTGGRWVDDTRGYIEALRAWAVAPEPRGPEPVMEKRRTTWVEYKRVAASTLQKEARDRGDAP
jgi:hypothetical protein